MFESEEDYLRAVIRNPRVFAPVAAALGLPLHAGAAELKSRLQQAHAHTLEKIAREAEEKNWGYDSFGNPTPIVFLLALYLPYNYTI